MFGKKTKHKEEIRAYFFDETGLDGPRFLDYAAENITLLLNGELRRFVRVDVDRSDEFPVAHYIGADL